MATITAFEDMEVWQHARSLSKRIYWITQEGSFSRDFRLKDQINASSASIMDNIAEGFERDGAKEFVQFLSFAKGSAGETRSQLYNALDRSHITEETFIELKEAALGISKQLSGLMRYLNKGDYIGLKYIREPNEIYLLETQSEI
jgi:four helix bundle protein